MERLGDFLQGHRGGMLERIYLAQRLKQQIEAEFPGSVTVTIRRRLVVITCQEAAQAERLNLGRRRLMALISKASPAGKLTLKIRLKG